MSLLVQSKLFTSYLNTSGWTSIRENGRVVSYIRDVSFKKQSPPQDSRTIVLHEKGAQVTIIIPFLPDNIEYLETGIVEIPIGKNETRQSEIVGCKCILDGVDLRTNQLSDDKREMILTLMPGSNKIQVTLDKQGELSVVLI